MAIHWIFNSANIRVFKTLILKTFLIFISRVSSLHLRLNMRVCVSLNWTVLHSSRFPHTDDTHTQLGWKFKYLFGGGCCYVFFPNSCADFFTFNSVSFQLFDCRNHVRVIQPMENGNRLYICGTNAHNPKDYVIYVSIVVFRFSFFFGEHYRVEMRRKCHQNEV